mgnify:CR=1 FL=1
MTRADLTAARLNAGYSIRGLARHLGISEQVVRRVEAGAPVQPANAKPLADFYGTTVTDLLGMTDRNAA